MAFRGRLDTANDFMLHGWAHSDDLPDLPVHIDIVINQKLACKLLADCYRPDLEAAGLGNGRKAFWFNPSEYFTEVENLVEVYFSDTDQLLDNGRKIIAPLSAKGDDSLPSLVSQAKSRWRGDEPDAGLTWGSIMTGDSFFDEVEKHFRFTTYTRILEIGPGYGRLLKTLLDRGHPFASFCGVDLSKARVDKLRRQFDDDRIRFEIGDCSQYKLSQSFDIGLCSATFEHLYPSIEQTLVNLRAQIDLNGMLFVDFIMHDENLSLSRAYFEEESIGGAYIRIYSLQELEPLFNHAGFAIQAAHPVVLGAGLQGETIRRMLICASARLLRRAKAESLMD